MSNGTTQEGASTTLQLIQLASGEALSVPDVDELLRSQPARLVALVGDRGSGKTTLIAAIYDCFLRGAFAGFHFAGSRSLVALERESHLARVESGRLSPDTLRTSRSEGLRFFHLAVVAADSRRHENLLLSDRAGEVYKEARGNSEVAADLLEVSKADVVCLLLDGARLIDPVERTGVLHGVRQTIRAFTDADVIVRGGKVQVILTKLDVVQRSDQHAEARTRLSLEQQALVGEYRERLRLSFWEVAARDPDGVLPAAHRVDGLFVDWLAPRTNVVEPQPISGPLVTEQDRLLTRTHFAHLR